MVSGGKNEANKPTVVPRFFAAQHPSPLNFALSRPFSRPEDRSVELPVCVERGLSNQRCISWNDLRPCILKRVSNASVNRSWHSVIHALGVDMSISPPSGNRQTYSSFASLYLDPYGHFQLDYTATNEISIPPCSHRAHLMSFDIGRPGICEVQFRC